MKKIVIGFLLIIFLIDNCFSQENTIYQRLNIKTESGTLHISAENLFEEETQFPFFEERSDTLRIPLYTGGNDIKFRLYTDSDSIKFILSKDAIASIDILKEGVKPFVLILTNGLEYENLQFNSFSQNSDFVIKYEKDNKNPYSLKLKKEYPEIDSIASQANTDLGKARNMASWVHSLWKHDGMNEPEQSDALYILNEVKEGKRFRCVEYGIVTTACLNSIGIPSRTLSLKTKDAEVRPTGAGHVVLEVFLKDMNKWIMIDPQWDIILHKNGIPLNATELQAAITNREKIDIWSSEPIQSEEYIPWIYPYLYYFSIKFDNRENINNEEQYTYEGKNSLMLVPLGAKNPTIFQQRFPIDYCFYTNSIKDFYNDPD